jgi:hypothetical protein
MTKCADCGVELEEHEVELYCHYKPMCAYCHWWRMGGPINDPLCWSAPKMKLVPDWRKGK